MKQGSQPCLKASTLLSTVNPSPPNGKSTRKLQTDATTTSSSMVKIKPPSPSASQSALQSLLSNAALNVAKVRVWPSTFVNSVCLQKSSSPTSRLLTYASSPK